MGERKWIISKDLSCFVLFVLKSLTIPSTMNGLLIYQAKVTLFPDSGLWELQEAQQSTYTPTTACWEKTLFQQKVFVPGCTKSIGIFTKCSQRPLRLPQTQCLYLAHFAYQIKSKLPSLFINLFSSYLFLP